MNESKRNDPRMWDRWRKSGAIGSIDATPKSTTELSLRDQYKTVNMPNREILVRKLHEGGVLGISDQTDSFFNSFANWVSGGEVSAEGIVNSWYLTMASTLADQAPVVQNAVDMYFDRTVDLITPDPEVAQQAKDHRKMVLEEIKKQNEAKRAAEPKLDLGPEDSIQDFDRFSQAIRVNEIMEGYETGGSRKTISIQDLNNPYYRQTHRGFFLEYYYGSPAYLHTPWGELRLGREAGRFTGDLDEFLGRLGATLYKPEVNNNQGTFGPVYAVHKIDDVELPDPIERPRDAYKEYKEVRAVWDELSRKYYEAKGQTRPLTGLEKMHLDDEMIEKRSKLEPPINDDDIKELYQLSVLRGKVVKYTQDGGKTWYYTKLGPGEPQYYQGGNLGFHADREVLPHGESHASIALTEEDFKNGMVVRIVRDPEEIKRMKFSYDFSKPENSK